MKNFVNFNRSKESDVSAQSDAAGDVPDITPGFSPKEKKQILAGLAVIAVLAYIWVLAGSVGHSESSKRLAQAVREEAKEVHESIQDNEAAINALSLDSLLELSKVQGAAGNYAQAVITDGRAMAVAQTRDEAMKLVSFADQYVQSGRPEFAEPFYRRAMSVLGVSLGTNSWEYLQVLNRLAALCHGMNRLDEEDQINAYIKQLSEQQPEQPST